MAVLTQVPLTTAIADLDEALRRLLTRELGRHGFDGVKVAFDAPTKEWAAALAGPAVNLFLFDLRESRDFRTVEWRHEKADGRARDVRPPLPLEASYAVTAWTRAVEDEHRLLSQVVAVLYAHPQLPDDVLNGALLNGGRPINTKVGQPREGAGADFWLAVGGQYKASVDYGVTVPLEAGTTNIRGPETRVRTVRTSMVDGPRGRMEESHRAAGTVRDEAGAPVADAWVAVEGHGGMAVTDDEGRFALSRVPAGVHPCTARAPDGREARGDLVVPGGGADLVLGTGGARRARKR
jgi:hypothetical protein